MHIDLTSLLVVPQLITRMDYCELNRFSKVLMRKTIVGVIKKLVINLNDNVIYRFKGWIHE